MFKVFSDIFNKKKEMISIVFSESEQFYMLFNDDFSVLKNQLGVSITSQVLNKYITLTFEDFKKYINLRELFEKYDLSTANKMDGVWIKLENDGSYSILRQERGLKKWKNKNVEENFIVDFYAKLILSIVEKHKNLNPI